MEPLVTPKSIPASAAKLPLDHTNKLFGIVYITLTGVIDTIVPTVGLWLWESKTMSYLIKLAPILWWALPTQSATCQFPNASKPANQGCFPDIMIIYFKPGTLSPKMLIILGAYFMFFGSKWAFIHSQKEDPLRNLLVYGLGVKETIWICQYLESSNNILYSLYLVLDFCTSVLDFFSLDLDSCSLNLDSGAALRIQLPILGLLLRYLGLYQSNQAPSGDQKASKTSWQKLRRPGKDLQKPSKRP
ncbi:hypothetical protein DSO57_1016834 [Entomophthora muscae]|uniref:Uncharacterized protein n=1 Tax=Entomophthora muscae TaxID=34485 RepID=A0ACC2UQA3_9FUNG|nr:hypothetical protein DSO57_1016834 [Entomophthora muscae]